MSSYLKTVPAALAIAAAAIPVTAFAAGFIETTLAEGTQQLVMMAVGMLLAATFTWAAATSERFAAPARAKSPQDRTLADRAIIEADKRIDALNIAQLETFISRFVLSRIDKVLAGPLLDPMRQADELLVEGIDAFKRRNPELAAQMKIDPTSMRELIAAGIGQVRKDALGQALADAGVRAENLPVAVELSGSVAAGQIAGLQNLPPLSVPSSAAPADPPTTIVNTVVVDGADPAAPVTAGREDVK